MSEEDSQAPSNADQQPSATEEPPADNEPAPEPPAPPAEEAKPEEPAPEEPPPAKEPSLEQRPSKTPSASAPQEAEESQTSRSAQELQQKSSKVEAKASSELPKVASQEVEVEAKKSKEPVDEESKRKSTVSAGGKETEEQPVKPEKSKSSQEVGDEVVQKKSEVRVVEASESFDRKKRTSVVDGKETRKSRSERLGSRAQKVLGSAISIHRLSTIGEFYDRTKGARYMNSYKLDPDNPFKPEKVYRVLESVMIEALENLTYDKDKCAKQAKWASSAIRGRVKDLQFDRYKLVCLVTIGEKNDQDALVTCRFLWDVDRDRYSTFSLENTYVFGIAMCFGMYYE